MSNSLVKNLNKVSGTVSRSNCQNKVTMNNGHNGIIEYYYIMIKYYYYIIILHNILPFLLLTVDFKAVYFLVTKI